MTSACHALDAPGSPYAQGAAVRKADGDQLCSLHHPPVPLAEAAVSRRVVALFAAIALVAAVVAVVVWKVTGSSDCPLTANEVTDGVGWTHGKATEHSSTDCDFEGGGGDTGLTKVSLGWESYSDSDKTAERLEQASHDCDEASADYSGTAYDCPAPGGLTVVFGGSDYCVIFLKTGDDPTVALSVVEEQATQEAAQRLYAAMTHARSSCA
jgi:hypothetical protein